MSCGSSLPQTPKPDPVRLTSPFGLLRLQDATKPGEVAKLVPSKFAIDPLPANGPAEVIRAQKTGKKGFNV